MLLKILVFLTFSGTAGDSIGGKGGDSVCIIAGANDTEVRLCTFSNTGTGGIATSGTDGIAGRAVTDLVTDACSRFSCSDDGTGGASVVFSNFAYAIGNLDQRYVINGTTSVESGTNVNASPNQFSNVYFDCFP